MSPVVFSHCCMLASIKQKCSEGDGKRPIHRPDVQSFMTRNRAEVHEFTRGCKRTHRTQSIEVSQLGSYHTRDSSGKLGVGLVSPSTKSKPPQQSWADGTARGPQPYRTVEAMVAGSRRRYPRSRLSEETIPYGTNPVPANRDQPPRLGSCLRWWWSA